MIKTRVIPVVLWDGVNCVQTVRFGRPSRVFGSLTDVLRVYERRNVDELILLHIDTVKPDIDQIKWFTSQMFCPITVGGGVSSLDDIRKLLLAGADKVAIRTAAEPLFIEEASRKFGAQAIVFSLDVPVSMPLQAASIIAHDTEVAGAGEILLTSIDYNGTQRGYDLDLISEVANAVTIPVIAHGGCGTAGHMVQALQAGAHAVAASTMFLFTETTPRECSKYIQEHGFEARVI